MNELLSNNIHKKYDVLIIDSVNLAYRVFNHDAEAPVLLSNKSIYKESICKFIRTVEDLKKKYIHSDGSVYLLFDNYFSKADLENSFIFADRKKIDEAYKKTRKKENRPFYTSLNFIRYYYMIGPDNHYTIRIPNLEADDIVPSLLENELQDKSCLFITTDLDWCRYLNDKNDYLPDLSSVPVTNYDVSSKLGFPLTTDNLITYKSLFGDRSDNIPGICTLNDENLNSFRDFIKKGLLRFPLYLTILSRNPDRVAEYPFLGKIKEDEPRYATNVQLISAIECSKDTLESYIVRGRFSETLYKTVRAAVGLTSTDTFVFGNVKRTRIGG